MKIMTTMKILKKTVKPKEEGKKKDKETYHEERRKWIDHARTHHSSSVLETIMVTKSIVIIKYEKTVFNI